MFFESKITACFVWEIPGQILNMAKPTELTRTIIIIIIKNKKEYLAGPLRHNRL